jgi:hypothetical protein
MLDPGGIFADQQLRDVLDRADDRPRVPFERGFSPAPQAVLVGEDLDEVVGPPAQVIDGIKSIEAKYPGLEQFMIHWAEGIPPKEFKEQLRWFAREVMPAFGR